MAHPFVGRDEEIAAIREIVDEAAVGHGDLLLVAGEPGIGKTRLVREGVDYAQDKEVDVRWASCWEGAGAPAYWPLIQVLRQQFERMGSKAAREALNADAVETLRLVPEVAKRLDVALPEVTAGLDPEQARFQLFDAVVMFLRRSADGRPTLIVVDDLHWADQASLLFLRFLRRALHGSHIGVVGTYRDEEAYGSEALAALLQGSKVIPLRGLSESDTRRLVAQAFGQPADPASTSRLYRRTGGNPLFVLEVSRLVQPEGRNGSQDIPIPEGVRAVIHRRVGRLSDACGKLLATASAIGNEFRIDLLYLLAGLGRAPLLQLLDEAEVARLVTPLGAPVGRYGFAHALVREVIYTGMPRTRRLELHRDVGEALEKLNAADIDSHVAELAHHFGEAATGGDFDRAVGYAERAGRRALELLAYEEAVEHLEHAIHLLHLEPFGNGRRISLLLVLGEAKVRAGDLPGARAAFDDVAESARAVGDATALAQAALGLGTGPGGFEIQMLDRRQVELLEEALSALGAEDSVLKVSILGRLSVALSLIESVDRRCVLAEQAVAMARRLGDERALSYALAAHCDAIAGPDDVDERLREATEIIEIAARTRDPSMELLGRRLRILALLELGDFPAFEEEVNAYANTAGSLRQPLYTWYVPLWRGLRAVMRGDFATAERFIQEADEVGARATSLNARMLTNVLGWVAKYQRGRPGESAKLMDEFYEQFSDTLSPRYADITLGWLAAAEGRVEQARALIAPHVHERMRSMAVDAEWLPLLCQVTEYARFADDAEAASLAYELMTPYEHLFGVEGIGAGTWGPMSRFMGLAATVMGRIDAAEQHFDTALARCRRAGAPLLVALVLHEYALALLRRKAGDDGERAREFLLEAIRLYRGFGVERWLDEAEALLGEAPEEPAMGNLFRRDGEYWTVAYGNHEARIKDVKGLQDLAVLLRWPGKEVHALDLVGARDSSGRKRPVIEGLHEQGHAGEVLDDEARDTYRHRLRELEEEIQDAETLADTVRAEKARAERDAITAQLAAAYGLGGRKRRSGDPAERARSTVTQRIRDAISRIEKAHPELGHHLRHSVRTGTYCSYAPEQPTIWEFERLTP